MTTALVTGVTGQDGTLLARRLLVEGFTVHGTAVSDADRRAWLVDAPPGVTVHIADVTDAAAVLDVVRACGPDEVYHLAGISSVALSWAEPVLTGAVTGVGAVAVFEACRQLQVETGRAIRVVQASSAEIFGHAAHFPQSEDTPLRPVTPYGAAKAYAHMMAAVYRTRGLHVATCILYNHESPLRPEAFVTRKITAAAARIADEGGELVLGSLDAARDWGWAEDYVDAMVRAVRHREPDDFVIATGVTHTVGEFVTAAFAHAGIDDVEAHLRIDAAFVRPAEAYRVVGDATKARRVLGWSPTVEFEVLVERMVDHDVALRRTRSAQ